MILYHSSSAEETKAFGASLAGFLKAGDVIALSGGLAAGKTTLTKGIAASLGIQEEVTSPTFTLVSVYEGRLPLYHMDMYRIGSVDEFLDLGADEMLYGEGVCVIEWSEKVSPALPEGTIRIEIEPMEGEAREIKVACAFEGRLKEGFAP